MKKSLNCSYRLVWSEVQRAFIVVSELTRAKGKRASGVVLMSAAVGSALASSAALAFTTDVTSAVQDEVVQGGTQNVLAGGVTTGHLISGQGVQIVAGGQAQQTTLDDGGVQIVRQQGSVTDTTINNGVQWVESDGQASNTVIFDGVQRGGTAYSRRRDRHRHPD